MYQLSVKDSDRLKHNLTNKVGKLLYLAYPPVLENLSPLAKKIGKPPNTRQKQDRHHNGRDVGYKKFYPLAPFFEEG
jgi:hypothetical protein